MGASTSKEIPISKRRFAIILALFLAALWGVALTASSSATAPTRITTKTIAVSASAKLHPGMRLVMSATWKHRRITRYQWLRCSSRGRRCGTIRGAIHRAYVVRAADVGHTLRARVTVQASTTAVTAPTGQVGRPAPVNTAVPTITDGGQGGGTLAGPIVGDILTGSNGTWQHVFNNHFTYQWMDCDTNGANCVNITGATTNTYTLLDADAGHTIVFAVTGFNF